MDERTDEELQAELEQRPLSRALLRVAGVAVEAARRQHEGCSGGTEEDPCQVCAAIEAYDQRMGSIDA